MWAISLYGLLPLHLVGGCWGAAGYINAENAPGIAIPVRLGDPNSGGTIADADTDAGKRTGAGCKNTGEVVLIGLGELVEGGLLQLSKLEGVARRLESLANQT